jgi:hypothetical protein
VDYQAVAEAVGALEATACFRFRLPRHRFRVTLLDSKIDFFSPAYETKTASQAASDLLDTR